jgi:flagellar biosynthetic protein FliQ
VFNQVDYGGLIVDIGQISEISREAIYVLIAVSAPILIISLCVGLVISLMQALTQIQEATLTFVPKIMVIYLSMIFLGSYSMTKMQVFADHIMQRIVG